MTAVALVGLVVGGLAVGLVSGLVGIGGGVLIVPLLYLFYAVPEWTGASVPPDVETAVAHATSLFIIVPTAVRGVITYERSGRVVWRAAVPLGAAAVLGAVVGARVAVELPGEVLRLAFGVLLIASAVQLVGGREAPARRRLRLSPSVTVTSGIAVGLLSALLGVGGGILAIPILIHIVGLDVEEVAATSLGVIVFAATAGTIAYIGTGWSRAGLPHGSLGYVHVLAALPILVGSLISVDWGARLNERLGTLALRRMFAVLFFVLGVRLILGSAGAVA